MKQDAFKTMYLSEFHEFLDTMSVKRDAEPGYNLSIEAINDWRDDLKKRGFLEKDIKARLSIAEREYNKVHNNLDLDFEDMNRQTPR